MKGRALNYRHTDRWKQRVNLYDDRKRRRFVVYRRVGSIEKRTSVRYGVRSRKFARTIAIMHATRIRRFPAKIFKQFKF